MDEGITSLAGLIIATTALVGLTTAGGLAIYWSDPVVEATVDATHCTQGAPYTVDFLTAQWAIRATVEVTADQCFVIQEGNFVQYSVRSGRTVIYREMGGNCYFDSAHPTEPENCGAPVDASAKR